MFTPSTCALYPCKPAEFLQLNRRQNVSYSKQIAEQKEHINGFNYSAFFEEQLEKKRNSSTYRVFRRILRDANQYPLAEDFTTGQRQMINVWCSNDYLGMSRHPMVRESAM